MEWVIQVYETPRGEKPVEVFIKRQPPATQGKIIHKLDLLEEYGIQLGMPHSKPIESGIYELRIRGKDEIRIFYAFRKKTIYLLHACKKQTQKTPRHEVEICLNRLVEIDRL